MKTIIHFLLIVLVFTSCSTTERMNRKCLKAILKYETAAARWNCTTVRDSTIIQSQVIIRDTTIYVPVPTQTAHDSLPVLITNGLMNTSVSQLETTYSRSKAWVENGTLKHTLDQRPSSIPIILPGVIHNSTSSTIQTIKVPYYVDRPISKPLHWWQKLFLWTGVIVWCLGGLYIAIRFYKLKTG